MSSLRLHEIIDADHRILNPFTDEKLALLGEVCRPRRGQRMLDLCCGKAELLATWARRHGISGVGVDISEVFLAAARQRVAELGVADLVSLVHADAATYTPAGRFDLVGCVGATWIGDGLAGTLDLLRAALAPGGHMIVGEPFWNEEPPPPVYAALDLTPELFVTLPATLDRFTAAGLDLVEMVLADPDSWDRYEAAHWATADRWLRANPGHSDAAWVRAETDRHRRAYLTYGRRFLGWGVFVLRPSDQPGSGPEHRPL